MSGSLHGLRIVLVGYGCKHLGACPYHPLPGEMIQFDDHIFQLTFRIGALLFDLLTTPLNI